MDSETPRTSLADWRLGGLVSLADLAAVAAFVVMLGVTYAAYRWDTYIHQQLAWQFTAAYGLTLLFFGLRRWWANRHK